MGMNAQPDATSRPTRILTPAQRRAQAERHAEAAARDARDAYMGHHGAALALVERIRDAIANDVSPDPEGIIHWGHVGDIAETRKELQEISDRLFCEGEYAD